MADSIQTLQTTLQQPHDCHRHPREGLPGSDHSDLPKSRGFADVQEHPFFQNVDWDMMERKQVIPPFKPNISDGFGLDNFDPQFTNEPFQLTMIMTS
ncbi:protein kinase C iota type-like [Heterocephalus glaber]|uniref:Protein kinase C iota type-like n=1 Tax=Heterocephalus glaber TaxID=10181 RepID=A0AAX6RV45_HETGA|nr:protein kinase C iota type-like [Heterocephalus glaber]